MISLRRRLNAEMNSRDPAADEQRLQTFRGELEPIGPETHRGRRDGEKIALALQGRPADRARQRANVVPDCLRTPSTTL
jgi:hypothetical protein